MKRIFQEAKSGKSANEIGKLLETEHIEKRRVSVRSPGVHDVAVDLVLLHSVAGI